MTRSLVIVHPGSLGDVLLAVPAVQRLRARYSGLDTLLIARDSISRLLVACGVVNDWMSLEGPAGIGLFARGAQLPPGLESWLNRCDVAVAWLEDSENVLRANLQAFNIPQVWIQSPSSPTLRARHQSHRFLEIVGESVDAESQGKFIDIPATFFEEGTAQLERVGIPRGRPFVLVHPGSGSRHKCLNPETIVAVIQGFEQKGILPVVLEGPADQDAVERVLKRIPPTFPTFQNLDLTTLAGVLVQARFFLGHDSGVTHLAAILGVRTVAVFGPTDPERWAPLGAHVTIVQGPPCVCRSWDEVRQCYEKPCLDVSPDQIFTALDASGLT